MALNESEELELLELEKEQSQGQRPARQEQVDTSTGAPASVRAQASFFSSPEEKYKFFERSFQPENVRRSQAGETEYRRPDKTWARVDEEGPSWADIADFAGDVPEVAGSIIGGLAGSGVGSVPGAAAGAGLGNILKQFIASKFGESRSFGERATDAGISTAVGGAGQKVANVLAKSLRSVSMPKTRQTAYTEEGKAAAREVGGKLTWSQETGSLPLKLTEDQTRRNFMAADMMEQFEINQQIAPAKAYLDRVMSQLHPGEVPDAQLGKAIQQGYERVITVLQEAAENPASRDQALASMQRLQNSVLEARLGQKIPEESLARHADWLKGLKPEELEFSLNILQHTTPNIREQVMRNFLQDSFEKAVEQTRHTRIPGSTRPEFRAESLLMHLPDQKVFDSILGKGNITKRQIVQLTTFLERVVQRNPATLTLQQTPASILAKGGTALANLPISALIHRLVAKLLISPQFRDQARIVAKTAGRPFTAPAALAVRHLERTLPAAIQEVQQEIKDEGA